MKLFALTSAACILLSAVPSVFSNEVSCLTWNYIVFYHSPHTLSLSRSFVAFRHPRESQEREIQLRGSSSALAKAIESFRSAVFDSASAIEGDELNVDVKVKGDYKTNGLCGTANRSSRSTGDADYFMPWNYGVMIDADAAGDDNYDDDGGYDDDDNGTLDCDDAKYDGICDDTCN
ncbi:hypothetical protein ACHAW5_000620 [Stephanodiscus triporus]|uniref:Uncharacterized protein n=1 Tax=Stephanodiscus triporus TaxID=2934178 RepID=A0ABD3NVA7_9STRA